MKQLFDFSWYAPNALKILTKTKGVTPLKLRVYQKKYIQHLKDDFPDRIIRSLVVKARQCGFSTLIAALNFHGMATRRNYKGIMLADKADRTDEVFGIYDHFVNNLPAALLPMIDVQNNRELHFANPKKELRKERPGQNSGIKCETAQDPNAGRSGTRSFGHLTEYGFYPYAESVDEGVQNSIPLAPRTFIAKESTANGMTGNGEALFLQWEAAVRGDTIYKPFFVSWFEVDDYALRVPHGFRRNKYEIELCKICPTISDANLVWRRLKLLEYSAGKASVFTPKERFKQDFPSFPEEAFLSSGRPIFDLDRLRKHIRLLMNTPYDIASIKVEKEYLSMYRDLLTVWEVPVPGETYSIGGDVAEGVEGGDYSNAFVLDSKDNQVAVFHGHLDPDHFGKVLVELAIIYNQATLVPEINNMGHTTLNAIKESEYLKVYMRTVYDEIANKETEKMGWRTTSKNKMTMLGKLVSRYRDGEIRIRDVELLKEMSMLTRESDGNVNLTGKDRVVGACLAIEGRSQIYLPAIVHNPNKTKKLLFETRDESRAEIMKKEKKTGLIY